MVAERTWFRDSKSLSAMAAGGMTFEHMFVQIGNQLTGIETTLTGISD